MTACPRCGMQLPPHAMTCTGCGLPLSAVPAPLPDQLPDPAINPYRTEVPSVAAEPSAPAPVEPTAPLATAPSFYPPVAPAPGAPIPQPDPPAQQATGWQTAPSRSGSRGPAVFIGIAVVAVVAVVAALALRGTSHSASPDDKVKQDMSKAAAAEQNYFNSHGTYTGFGPDLEAAGYKPVAGTRFYLIEAGTDGGTAFCLIGNSNDLPAKDYLWDSQRGGLQPTTYLDNPFEAQQACSDKTITFFAPL